MNKVVEALLAGGKMLSIHCATCRSPLFESGQKIFCPICGEKPLTAKPEATEKPQKSEAEQILREKLNALTAKLKKETDHDKTLELLEEIKSLLEAIQKLK